MSAGSSGGAAGGFEPVDRAGAATLFPRPGRAGGEDTSAAASDGVAVAVADAAAVAVAVAEADADADADAGADGDAETEADADADAGAGADALIPTIAAAAIPPASTTPTPTSHPFPRGLAPLRASSTSPALTPLPAVAPSGRRTDESIAVADSRTRTSLALGLVAAVAVADSRGVSGAVCSVRANAGSIVPVTRVLPSLSASAEASFSRVTGSVAAFAVIDSSLR